MVLFTLFLFTGCGNNELNTIYTTVYPIEFLTKSLYGNHATITSIYPNGTKINEYELTSKQIDTYSKGTFFIYNGTTEEKQIAKMMVNKRKKLKIIDVAYSLKYEYGMEELWLSPSNFLMLATNLKDGLENQVGSKYTNEEIDKNFRDLEERLSIMDAEIRSTAKNAVERGKNTIIASQNVFKFLEDYGFTVISLADYEKDSPNFEALKNNFKSGTYTYILVSNLDQDNELVKELSAVSKVETITVPFMHTLEKTDVENNNDYFTMMNDFLSNLKTMTNN